MADRDSKARPYRVPSKDYRLQFEDLAGELIPEIERVMAGENPVLGASVDRFEEEFAGYLGCSRAVGVNSGTDALVLTLRALGIGPGQEVITNANTFIATVSAIVMAGAEPVLVEPDRETMNISPAAVEAAITERTAALLPAHMYGLLGPMEELDRICRDKGLALVEDAAQAHGAGRGGRRAGAWGRAGCFSFHPSKNLGAWGDGGMVTTSDEELDRTLRRMRNLGKETKYLIRQVAPNSKLDTLQAAILRIKLPRLEGWLARRRHLARIYRDRLDGVGDLVLPLHPTDGSHAYHLYVVRTGERDRLRTHLKERGINAGLHYPVPPHLQELDRPLGPPAGALPVTEECAAQVLSLPISPELTDAQVEHVCATTRAFFGG